MIASTLRSVIRSVVRTAGSAAAPSAPVMQSAAGDPMLTESGQTLQP